MSIQQIIVRTSPGETLTALLSKGRLVEIHIDRAGARSVVGNIYLGRVKIVQKSLDAAFVSIGEDRDGFLALPEARPTGKTGGSITDYVSEGLSILVQAQRDHVEDKGVKLTTHINLAGIFLVLRPLQEGVTVSRSIVTKDKRERLKNIAINHAPKDGGFIVRTRAEDASDEEIRKDAEHLTTCWHKIISDVKAVRAPTRVFAELNPACKALQEYGGKTLREIIIDGTGALYQINEFCKAQMPWLTARVTRYKGLGDVFEDYGIAEQIDDAFTLEVDLIGGGFLIINQTPALCAIDVNTGSSNGISREQTAFDVNLQAAIAVAFQIRLRNISGLILVDFVSLRAAARRDDVLKALKDATATDPLNVNIGGFTRLGLVEMTRQRHGRSLQSIFSGLDIQKVTKSFESQALDALRRVMFEIRSSARSHGVGQVLLRAPKGVIAELKGSSGHKATSAIALEEAQAKLGLAIKLEIDKNLDEGQFEVVIGNKERNYVQKN